MKTVLPTPAPPNNPANATLLLTWSTCHCKIRQQSRTDFSTLGVGGKKIDDFDSRFQDFLGAAGIYQIRWRCVDCSKPAHDIPKQSRHHSRKIACMGLPTSWFLFAQDISVICLTVVLKLATRVFIRLYFLTETTSFFSLISKTFQSMTEKNPVK